MFWMFKDPVGIMKEIMFIMFWLFKDQFNGYSVQWGHNPPPQKQPPPLFLVNPLSKIKFLGGAHYDSDLGQFDHAQSNSKKMA